VAFHCPRSLWFKWKTACRANGATVEKATVLLLEEKLRELGIELPERPEDSALENPQLAKVQ
jgi:hypothetical protein